MKTPALLLSVLLIVSCRTAGPQPASAEPEWIERTSEVRRLNCYSGETFGSRYGRSEPLVSPGGRSAWSEVRAIASQPGDETTRACRNVSRLWISGGSEQPVLAFEQNPGAEGRNGNSIVPVAWSPDGERLLFELDTWTYYTDREPPTLAIWVGPDREVERIPLEVALKSSSGTGCGYSLRALGFTPEGKVLIETGPLPAEEGGLPPCEPLEQRWTVEPDGSLSDVR